MSCSAKLPIYAMFTAAFFTRYQALVMIGLYVMGMVIGVIYGLILKAVAFKGEPVPFVMELPNYRLPSAKSVLRLMWEKAKDFLVRAFTVIFVASLLIWFLQTFDSRLNVVTDSAGSLLAALGGLLAPLFAHLGFGDWRVSTALITGFSAKEAVVSTLAVLTGSSLTTLPAALSAMFTPFTAFVFLTFTLLYTPCVAAIAAVKREMGGAKAAALVALSQCAIAWVVAFAVRCIGLALGFNLLYQRRLVLWVLETSSSSRRWPRLWWGRWPSSSKTEVSRGAAAATAPTAPPGAATPTTRNSDLRPGALRSGLFLRQLVLYSKTFVFYVRPPRKTARFFVNLCAGASFAFVLY